MKTWKVSLIGLFLIISAVILMAFSFRRMNTPAKKKIPFVPPKGCVFRTVMGEESSDSSFIYKTPEKVIRALDRGLDFISHSQNKNGGWGAGSHNRQDVMDPHAVVADPATTSMVAMAMLRSGTTLKTGQYSSHLSKALNFLLESTEKSPASSYNITDLTGTQIQIKLGRISMLFLRPSFSPTSWIT